MNNKTINNLYFVSGILLILMTILIIAQVALVMIFPSPIDAEGYLKLYNSNKFDGMIRMGLLFTLHNILLIVPYLALFLRLRDTNYVLVLASFSVMIICLSIYSSINPCFDFINLSRAYVNASDGSSKQIIVAFSELSLMKYRGSGLTIYYLLGGVATLLMVPCMRLDSCFGKPIIISGFLAAGSMFFRAFAGNVEHIVVGIVLIPWFVFSILLGLKFLKIRNFYQRNTYYSQKGYEL